jgi:hypothetical protein
MPSPPPHLVVSVQDEPSILEVLLQGHRPEVTLVQQRIQPRGDLQNSIAALQHPKQA